MSGPFEKYVEQAAKAMEQFWAPLRGHTDYPDEIDFGLARAVLAAVGPLIEEDTRDRMVTAAGRALEMDVSHKPDGLYYCATSGEIEQYPGGGFDVCCALGPAGHEPISEIAFRAVRKQAAEETAQEAMKQVRGQHERTAAWDRGYAAGVTQGAQIAREIAKATP